VTDREPAMGAFRGGARHLLGRISIVRVVAAGFALIIAATAGAGAMVFLSRKAETAAFKAQDEARSSLVAVMRARLAIAAMHSDMRGYLLTGRVDLREARDEAVRDARGALAQLTAIAGRNRAGEPDLVAEAQGVLAEQIAFWGRLELLYLEDSAEAMKLFAAGEGVARAARIHAVLDEVEAAQQGEYLRREAEARRRAGSLMSTLLLAGSAQLLTLLGLYAALSWDVTRRTRVERALQASEDRFRQLTELSSDYYWELDERFRFTALSSGVKRGNGSGAEENFGRAPWELDRLEVTAARWAEHRALLESRRPFRDFELAQRASDGQLSHISLSGEPMFDAGGRFRGYRGVGRDVTGRKRAEEALQTSHRFIRATIDALDGQLCVVDASGTVVAVNRSWRDCGARNGGAGERLNEGANYLAVCEAASGAERAGALAFAAGLRAVLAGTRPSFAVEYRCDSPTEERWFLARVMPFADERSPPHAVILHVDISARKQAERALAESEARFRSLTQLSSDWYWEQDEQFRFTMFSDSASGSHPHVVGSALGKAGWELPDILLDEDEWAAHRALLEAHEPFHDFELRRAAPEGGVHYHLISGIPVFDATGTFRGYRGVGRDVTLARRAAAALAESEARHRLFLQRFQGIAYELCPPRVEPTLFDGNVEAITGYPAADFLDGATTWEQIVHPEDMPTRARVHEQLAHRAGAARELNYRIRRRDGEIRWVNEVAQWFAAGSGSPARVQGAIYDVTDRVLAEQRVESLLREQQAIVENAMTGIALLRGRRVMHCNQEFARVFGYSRSELVGRSMRQLFVSEREYAESGLQAVDSLAHSGIHKTERQMRRRDGALIWTSFTVAAVDREDLAKGTVMVLQDITEQRTAEEQLIQFAHFDVVTGLPNRVLFRDRLQQAVVQARRNECSAAVLFVDLDRFKVVNDTLGHSIGDGLLQQAGRRLRDAVRASDTVARLGGDEFAVILPDVGAPTFAGTVAQKILEELARPFEIGGREVFVSASVGISLAPQDASEPEDLVRHADAAMYRAKRDGRRTFRFYTRELNARAAHLLSLETDLRYALERGEFQLHYQPKVDVAAGAIAGFEALLRWRRGGGDLVPPADFVPLLEETGLIIPVGVWVIDKACTQLAAWRAAGLPPVRMAVNVSARQFQAPDFTATVREILARTGTPADLLNLEITESVLMQDGERSMAALGALKTMGVRLSIDDFGTGYSSLAYLTRLEIDFLKIDRSFVSDVPSSSNSAAITAAVIAVAHRLGLKVVAEGVERGVQLAFLAAHGCDEFQGYYFSRPVPPEEATELLARGSARPRGLVQFEAPQD
jgi:diguanylate cyclase (GGDEF)-like protein/PAS domain S-box-containing protein